MYIYQLISFSWKSTCTVELGSKRNVLTKTRHALGKIINFFPMCDLIILLYIYRPMVLLWIQTGCSTIPASNAKYIIRLAVNITIINYH